MLLLVIILVKVICLRVVGRACSSLCSPSLMGCLLMALVISLRKVLISDLGPGEGWGSEFSQVGGSW